MRRTAPFCLFFGLVVACDKDPNHDGHADPKSASASASGASAAVAATPATQAAADTKPTKPQLAVDDAAAYVAGERFDLAQPDPMGRLTAALAARPVAGETITLEAARDAKTARVETVFASLTAAKAKSVVVHTRRRDGVTAEIPFAIATAAKREPCTAVGYIAKDGAINAWTAVGTTALRFSRGMAGPDLTRGSEGVRKLVAACAAPSWIVAADDAITWGLVVDLVLAVRGGDDGGAPSVASAREVSLATRATPGQKIED